MNLNEEDKQVIRDSFCEALRNPAGKSGVMVGFDKASLFTDELASKVLETEHFSEDVYKVFSKDVKKLFIETEDFSGIGYYTKAGKKAACLITRSLDLSSPTDHEKHKLNVPYKAKYHHWIRILPENE